MIPRPFALVGFSYTAALAMMVVAGVNVWVLVACAVGFAVTALFVKRLSGRADYAVCAVSVLAACISFVCAQALVYSPALELVGEGLSVKATVTEVETSGDNTYYTLRADVIGGRETDCKLRLYLDEPVGAEIGDTLEFSGAVKPIGQNEESHRYYQSKGVYLWAYADGEVSVIPAQKHPFGYYAHIPRAFAMSALRRFIGSDEGELAVSMLTGDKSQLDVRINNAFRASGLSHTLAVSGLHMNIIVLALYNLVRHVFRRARRLSAAVCIPIALFYVVFSGFSVSAVRSCVAITVMLLAVVISRKSDSLNSLGLAALIITLANPYAVNDWSFMLSFSSTLGIVLLSPFLGKAVTAIRERIRLKVVSHLVVTLFEVLAVSLAATLFTLPVMILFVEQISLVSIPANLAVVFAVPVFMVSSVVTVLASLLPFGFAAQASAFISRLAGKYLLGVSKLLSGGLFSSVSLRSFWALIWLSATLAAVAFAVYIIRDKKKLAVFCTAFVSVTLVLTCAVTAFSDSVKVSVTAVNVGDGACFVVSKGTSAVLIGCSGDEYVVGNALSELGVTQIEAVLVPVFTEENDNCACEIGERYVSEQTVAYPGCGFEMLPEGTIITDSFSMDFHGVQINYRYSGGYDYCTLNADETSALFVFGTDTPQQIIKNPYADFLFSRAQPPLWLDTADYSAVAVSAGGNVAVNSGNVYSTFDNSGFTLSFNSRSGYEINLL